jgi:hypothetical protein
MIVIEEERKTYQKSTIKSLSALCLYNVMSRPPLSGIGSPQRLTLDIGDIVRRSSIV